MPFDRAYAPHSRIVARHLNPTHLGVNTDFVVVDAAWRRILWWFRLFIITNIRNWSGSCSTLPSAKNLAGQA